MKKAIYFTLLIFLLVPLFPASSAELSARLSGKILLQVEDLGQAWYLDSVTGERAFLGRPADAFRIMRELGLGISEADYNSWSGIAPKRLAGRILLRVHASGEAYYVNPDNLQMFYLGRPADAFRIMREQGLGINNNDLVTIPVSQKYQEPSVPEEIFPIEPVPPVEDEEQVATSTAEDDTDDEEEEKLNEELDISIWTGNIELEEVSLNADQNTLTGGVGLVGKLKFDAKYEDIIIEDLVLQNVGTAENNTLSKLYLFNDPNLLELLGAADVASGALPKAQFSNVNIYVEKTGVKYIYIGAAVKGIDYSPDPSPDATAEAESTIIIRVPANSNDFKTKVVGVTSGEDLGFLDLPTETTRTTTVYGAIISDLTTDFPSGPLFNGTARDIFSFKVTVPPSSNIDPAAEPLGIKLATVGFAVAVGGDLDLSNFRLERIGGVNGELAASAAYSKANGTLSIDFAGTYDAFTDLTIRPGNTAKYVIRADIGGVDSSDSLQVTIEDLENNFTYSHPVSALSDIENITPRLSAVDHLRGGVLSN